MEKYAVKMMEYLDIPQEAQEFFIKTSDKLNRNEEYICVRKNYMNYVDGKENMDGLCNILENIANEIDEHYYCVGYVFLLECLEEVRARYEKIGADKKIFLATVMDLKYKFDECLNTKGIYGTFVFKWFGRLLKAAIFLIGRFNFETAEFEYDRYEKDGVVINKGDIVLNIHIPPGRGMTEEGRQESYREAAKFFKDVLNINPKAFVCSSWLLSSANRKILPLKSNILGFMNDFDIIDEKEHTDFPFSWRIYGKAAELPAREWPEDTTIQKGYKKWILDGNYATTAYGVRIIK